MKLIACEMIQMIDRRTEVDRSRHATGARAVVGCASKPFT